MAHNILNHAALQGKIGNCHIYRQGVCCTSRLHPVDHLALTEMQQISHALFWHKNLT
jgi:hypothetical protein